MQACATTALPAKDSTVVRPRAPAAEAESAGADRAGATSSPTQYGTAPITPKIGPAAQPGVRSAEKLRSIVAASARTPGSVTGAPSASRYSSAA